MKKLIQYSIIGLGALSVFVIFFYMRANGPAMDKFVKQDEQRKVELTQSAAKLSNLQKLNNCLMGVLKYSNDYKASHPSMSAAEAEKLQIEVNDKQAACKEQYPE